MSRVSLDVQVTACCIACTMNDSDRADYSFCLRLGWTQFNLWANTSFLLSTSLIIFFIFTTRSSNYVQQTLPESNDAFEIFYSNYTEFLNRSLATKDFSAGIILHVSTDGGIGNQWPPLITSFLLAMLTQRIFLTDYMDVDKYFEPIGIPDVRWKVWQPVVSASKIGWTDMNCRNEPVPAHYDLAIKDLTQLWADKPFIRFISLDWNAPILFANPHYKNLLQKVFPGNAAFHPLAKKLMYPSSNYSSIVNKYMKQKFANKTYLVGMHIRMHKDIIDRKLNFEHFFSVAHELILKAKNKNDLDNTAIFVASDDENARQNSINWFQQREPSVQIVFQEGDFLNKQTNEGNPGTEDSAMFDLFVLERMNDLICTHGSSFGHVAAGFAGKEYHIVYGERKEGFKETDVLVTRTLTSEPCWYISKFLYEEGGEELKSAIRDLPGWERYLQCHYYTLPVPAPIPA